MTQLRWFQVTRAGIEDEVTHYVLADHYTVEDDWVTFIGDGLKVCSLPADGLAIVIDCAAQLEDPPELKADAAKKRTYRKETT